MIPRTRLLISIAVLAIVTVASLAVDFLLILPALHTLRTNIDNDRASKIVIVQQQSNLAQLAKDLESIQTKKLELETQIWTFDKEDSFFTTIEKIATTKTITIDAPEIADVTPTGAILPRSVTITIHGELSHVLSSISALQSITPLIALQQESIVPDEKPGHVRATLTANTLWK